MRWLIRLVLPVLAAVLAATAPAHANHLTVSLVAESPTISPGGSDTLALAMTPAPGWHGYWQNPGDAGLPTEVAWTLPRGATAGPLRYPVPQTLVIAGLMNHVYEGPYALLTTLTAPRDAARGQTIPVVADVHWLVCSATICVPEQGRFTLHLTVGAPSVAGTTQSRFDGWRAALPSPLPTTGIYQRDGATVRLSLPYPHDAALNDPHLFAGRDGIVAYAAPQHFTRDGDRLLITTAASAGTGTAGPLDAVIAIGPGSGLAVTFQPGTVPAGRAGGLIATTLFALAGAFVGGLLLNLMPCVFPILSLKALSLARAGGAGAAARAEALGYTAGAVLVALALAGVLLALRAGGAQVGWAFQLQDPRVVGILLLLAVALTLNLAGLFELPVLAGSAGGGEGFAGGLATGALAAFVATPCSGPFMATAIGAALLLPWPAALAVFAGLGLGLSLPFLLIGIWPAARRLLPRPGPWLGRFRLIMAVPMGLTALALVWLLFEEAGWPGVGWGVTGAMLLAVMLLIVHARQRAGRRALTVPAGVLALLALAATILIPATAPGAAMGLPAGAVRFDPARLAALRAAHRPVFLYFTADWCLTCKVNEAAAIDRAEVRGALARHHVVTMVGDWTRRDAAITRFLTDHGRSGVPYYLMIAADGSEHELPQVLTPAIVEQAVGG